MGVLARELSILYGANLKSLPSPLPELPVQYADFALWQRDWLEGEVLDRQLAYWKRQLGGDLPVLALPSDYPRATIQTDRAGERDLMLPRDLSDALKTLCQQEGVTLFMLLLAAFDALLSRLTGGEDIVVGSPIAGRNSPEIENLIGFFVNTLVLRTDLSGDPEFRRLLARVREVTLGAYTHQDLPFEKLVEELNPERRLGHTPLFQVMLNMLSVDANPPDLESFRMEVIPTEQLQSKFDLTLYVTDLDEGLGLKLVFNATLFAESRMAEMLKQFKHLLAQVAARPDLPLSRIGLLTDSARKALPNPNLPLELSRFESVPDRIHALAVRLPDKVAMTDRNGSWKYSALDAVTTQLAQCICSRGIQQQDVIAIWASRDASLAIALLAVMKAGAAFVILDPAYPPSRLLESLNTAQPKGWINASSGDPLPPPLAQFVEKLPCRMTISSSKNDPCMEPLRNYSTQMVERSVAPDDLAYVAFTSGSRGHPKAIAGTYRPISHFLHWYCGRFGFGEADRFSVLSGLSHDPLLRDILAPLWVGGTACFPEPDFFEQPDRFRAWMKEEAITVSNQTPSMAKILATAAGPGSLPSLRHLFFGGDSLRTGDVRDLRSAAPSATCVNFYGTTETPQAVSHYIVPPAGPEQDETTDSMFPVPIGQGIEGAQLFVVTPLGDLAGIGESGEIYVRTPYLATGYISDPELTAAKFIANPFTQQSTDRCYKTGDIGRFLPDGKVQFLGRNDDQLKVRGFRIEAGEVEAVLSDHPVLRQAAVTAREDVNGERRLVAYVTRAKDGTVELASLREFLRRKLPSYMVPSAFVFLDALPLLPNGKIDCRRLPPPDESGAAADRTFVAPRSELELRLTRIWEEVLGVRRIGVKDDFFDLGGHSLMGVRLLAKIEKVFNKKLPLSAIFQSRNVEQLSAVLRQEGWLSSWYSLVPIQPCGSRPPLFGIHDLHYKDMAACLGIEQPIYGLRYGLAAHTRDGVAILPSRIEDLAAHYIQEMRALQPEGPYYLMGLSFGGVVAFEMAQQLYIQQQEVALLALFDSYISTTERPLPLNDVLSNLVMLGPSAVLDRVKYRATRIRAKFRKGGYEPHIHHPWGVQRDLADAYLPKTYPGKVVLFKAAQPAPTVFHTFDPPEIGWKKWAAGGCEVHEVPGGHVDMLEEPHIRNVTAILRRNLPG
jgi:amino acid adenylation domain-containing protein